MKLHFITLVLVICFFELNAQKLYDPYQLYDPPGTMFDVDSLRSLYISFYNESYDSILHDSWKNISKLRLPARIIMNKDTLDSVGIRYKGNSTYYYAALRQSPKVPLNIDINEYIRGQTLLGYKKLKLANVIFDPTFVKEIVGLNIYQKYLPSSESNLIKVYIDNEYIGVYANIETIDSKFLKKHFGENNGVLFKCDPIWRYGDSTSYPDSPNLLWLGSDIAEYDSIYELKSDYGWKDLINFINLLNNGDDHFDSLLNVDRVLWYFAVNSVIMNLDTYNCIYTHNYYLYKTKDSLFQIIPWDCSESFIGALYNNVNPFNENWYTANPFFGAIPFISQRPLVYQLLYDSTYAKQYIAHIRTILNEIYQDDYIKDYVTKIQKLARSAVSQDPNNQFNIDDYFNNVKSPFVTNEIKIGGILSTVEKRLAYLLTNHHIIKKPPEIGKISVGNNGNAIMVMVGNGNNVELMATISKYNSKFQSFKMSDDGNGIDKIAGDGVFSVNMPFQGSGEKIKFYIRAQNNDAMKLSPERAEYQFYILDPVNIQGDQIYQNSVQFTLAQNYPNPVKSTTLIRYTLPANCKINLTVYNLVGKEVKTLVNNFNPSGSHEVVWDGKNHAGNNVSPGIYIYKLQSAEQVCIRKMTLSR